jgi:4-amino-4-deoxy-L-arabinose transferase-like glycosyltransferase
VTSLTRREAAMFATALLVIAVLTGAFAWSIGRAPDETSHLTMVQHYAHHLDLTPRSAWLYGTQRGHGYNLFSPLPYVPYLPFDRLDDVLGAVHGAERPAWFVTRLGGLLIAFAQLLASYALVRRLRRKGSRVEALAVALAVSLVPQMIYVHSYVNADAVTILLGTVGFLVALRLVQQGRVALTDALLAGFVIGLIALARYNAFSVGAVVFGALAYVVARNHLGARRSLRYLGVACALPLLMAGAFHLHVYNELRNDHLLASSDNQQLRFSTFEGRIRPDRSLKLAVGKGIGRIPDVWSGLWASFAVDVRLVGIPLLFLAAGALVGLVGLLVMRRFFDPAGWVFAVLAVVLSLMTWAGMATQWSYSQEGRFVLPVAAVAMCAVVLGSAAVLERIVPARWNAVLVASGTWATVVVLIDLWALVRMHA